MRLTSGVLLPVCGLVIAAACGPAPPPRPLDTSTKEIDFNGFPVNPLLATQITNPQGPGALADFLAEGNPSQLSCVPKGNGTLIANDQRDPTNWYGGTNPCTHYQVTTHGGNALSEFKVPASAVA